ncbi:hypothetical protein DXG01_004955 [Tephrocybe rancida]|nr:hypothetical protein DXG01_004955 [Tephrocybe rancida]
MSKSEDVIPTEYTYSWNSDSNVPLQDFLVKYKPSMVQNDGKKPWIWVRGSAPTQEDTGVTEALEEASVLLKEVTEKVEAIKNDAAIPVRSNKKTGAKSKKEVREQVQADATDKLKEIATKHGFVSGKWLIFVSADKVDMIWSNLAKSLISGPLASTFAHLAKVATSPESQDSPNHQHLICVYIPNVYDKDKVTEVMKVLLRNHGVSLSGVKSNLYTALGIDSKHASGLPSTTWKNSSLLSDAEAKVNNEVAILLPPCSFPIIQELKDAFFANLTPKTVSEEQSSGADTKGDAAVPTSAVAAPSKMKPKLKKKVVDDPFASDNDDDDKDEEKRKQEIQAKVAKKPLSKKKVADDTFASDEEYAGETKHREEVQAKKAMKRQASHTEEDEEQEDERHKKKKTVKSHR